MRSVRLHCQHRERRGGIYADSLEQELHRPLCAPVVDADLCNAVVEIVAFGVEVS